MHRARSNARGPGWGAVLAVVMLGMTPARAAAEDRLIVRAGGLLGGLPVVKSACRLLGCNVLYALDGTLNNVLLVAVPDVLDTQLLVTLLSVVPGIIDNHNHIVAMGNRPGYHTPLENATSIADVQSIIAAHVKGAPKGVWITTIGGFHRNHLVAPTEKPRLPTLAELDKAAPNNPVFISEGFNGPSATNSAGKKVFESQTPPIPVGADGAIGGGPQATGRALLLLRQTLLNETERRRGAIDALNYGLSLGVTTHLDQGVFQATSPDCERGGSSERI